MNFASSMALFDLGVMPSSVTQQVTWLMLHFMWQGLLLGAIVIATDWGMRGFSPNARYRMAVVSMLMLVLCVPLTWLAGRTAENSPSGATALWNSHAPVGDLIEQPHDSRAYTEWVSYPAQPRPTLSTRWSIVAATGYAIGVCSMLLRMAFSWIGVHRMRHQGKPVDDSQLLSRLKGLSSKIGLRDSPPVRVCQRATVPVVFGALKPVILLPAFVVSGMTGDELDAILLHELAHIRRGDLIVNCLQRIAESLLFFHPVTWYLSHLITAEREHCCDDVVLARCEGVDYASALVRLAEIISMPSLGALAITGSRPSQLKRRVMRILGASDAHRFDIRGVVLALTCVIVMSTVVLRVNAQTEQPSPDAPLAEATVDKQDSTVDEGLREDRKSIQRIREGQQVKPGEVLETIDASKTRQAYVTARGNSKHGAVVRSVELAKTADAKIVEIAIGAYLDGKGIRNSVVYRTDGRSVIFDCSQVDFELVDDFLRKRNWKQQGEQVKVLILFQRVNVANASAAIRTRFDVPNADFVLSTDRRTNLLTVQGAAPSVFAIEQFAQVLDEGPLPAGSFLSQFIQRSGSATWTETMRDRIAEGKAHFEHHCVHCHGKDGDGKGLTAPFLNVPPADFSRRNFKNVRLGSKHAIRDIENVILRGSPGSSMPSFELLSKNHVNALAEYVRYLASNRQLPKESSDGLRFPVAIERAMMSDGQSPPAASIPKSVPYEVERGMMLDAVQPLQRRQ